MVEDIGDHLVIPIAAKWLATGTEVGDEFGSRRLSKCWADVGFNTPLYRFRLTFPQILYIHIICRLLVGIRWLVLRVCVDPIT